MICDAGRFSYTDCKRTARCITGSSRTIWWTISRSFFDVSFVNFLTSVRADAFTNPLLHACHAVFRHSHVLVNGRTYTCWSTRRRFSRDTCLLVEQSTEEVRCRSGHVNVDRVRTSSLTTYRVRALLTALNT